MSGGYFDYKDYYIGEIADSIERVIFLNDDDGVDEDGYPISLELSKETIEQFRIAIETLRIAQTYVHRIDYLLEGDDDEENFHTRLANDLKQLKQK